MPVDARHLGKRIINALPLLRSGWRRYQHQLVVERAPTVRDGIAAFTDRWGNGTSAASAEQPVFIFSAGWRSGSTLLQRLAMSSGTAFLWGEPYHECAYVQRMADSLRAFSSASPTDDVFHEPRANGTGHYDDAWVANLFPAAEHLLAAHRAFFDRLLAAPALEGGFQRWGFKGVRLSMEHAYYLRWLYPGARFLFQVRNPYKAYRSYRLFRPWYSRWPDQPVLTAADFGAFWLDLARGFVREHTEVGGRLVRYEELAAGDGTLIEELSEYVGLPLPRKVLERKVLERRWPLQAVPLGELESLRRAVEPLATELGYLPTRG